MFLVAEIRFCADIAEFLQTVKGINGRSSGKFAKYASAKQIAQSIMGIWARIQWVTFVLL